MVTKLDLMDAGTDAVDVLCGRGRVTCCNHREDL